MSITELRRDGANVLEEDLAFFVWDSQTHTMTQDSLDIELQVNTQRDVPPGAEEPVEHVMSTEWVDVPFHGEWKEQWAGRGFIQSTYDEFARMVLRTPLVRITVGSHTLVGLIKNFKVRYRTEFELGWQFTLSVHRNESVGTARKQQIVPLTALDFSQRVTSAQDSAALVRDTLVAAKSTQFSTEALDDAQDGLADLDASLANAQFAVNAVAFEDSAASPNFLQMIDQAQHKLLAVAASFARVRQQAQDNLLQVSSIVTSDVMAYNDVIGTLRVEEWTRTQYVECVRLMGSAKSAEIDARARASRRPRGIHRVKRGDTLDRVSMKWYGSPDSGRLIIDANNLDSVLLPVGQDLIIPDVNR